MNIIKIIFKAVDSIKLNLGIKTFIIKVVTRSILFFDTRIVWPIYNLINNYFINKIIYRFGVDYRWGDQRSQNINKKNHSLGYGLIHESVVINKRPKRILCVGSMYGFIPYMMARGCAKNGSGRVDFVDAGYNIDDQNDKGRHSFGLGFWKRINAKKHFNYLIPDNIITTYVMTSKEFAAKHKYKYDYIYLDGDHTYKGVVNDLRLFWPRLNKDGLLCLHDIHFNKIMQGIKFGFWRIWQDLRPMPFKLEISNYYSGLGFIQKKGRINPLQYLKK